MEENRVLTIVFTDIKGFTERTSSIDREAVSQLLKKHEELLLPLVASYDGRLIKTIGDAFLLTFASPTNAVLCAVMMQEKLKEFNAGQPEIEKIEIRVAINTGEVLMRDGDVFGEPVNIAARIEGLTEANEVWFSESTYLAMNRKEVPTSLIGEYRLKGIPEAVKVYRVVRDPNDQEYAKTVHSQIERLKMQISTGNISVIPKKANWPYFVAIALILLLLFVSFRESEFERNMRKAGELQANKNFKESIEFLRKAAAENRDDQRLATMLSNAVDEYVEQRLQIDERNQQNIAELQKFARETRVVFSLPELRLFASEIKLSFIAAQFHAAAREREKADKILDELAASVGSDSQVLLDIAEFYRKRGYNWHRTIRYFHAAAMTDPASFSKYPGLLEEYDWFLKQVSPSEGYDEVRTFILDHNFDHFAPVLRESLYKAGEEFHSLRWNAMKMLESKGEKVDKTMLYLTDLLTSPNGKDTPEIREILAYLTGKSGPAFGAEIERCLKTLPGKFPLFETYLFVPGDQVMKVVAGPLFMHLQNYLHELLLRDRIPCRMNAYMVLQSRQALGSIDRWKYYCRNINDFRQMQWSASYYPALIESLDYMIKNDLPKDVSADKEFAEIARQAAKSVKAMLDQELEAVKNKDGYRYFKEYEREQKDLEKLIEKLKL
jgi:class 3 adenylate cyclase